MSKKQDPEIGYVYALTNQAYNYDLIKIGMTAIGVDERMAGLYNTSTPLPFKCLRAVKVKKPKEIETYIHNVFERYRFNKSREFFTVTEEEINSMMNILIKLGAEDATPEISSKVEIGTTQTENDISDKIKYIKEQKGNRIPFIGYGIQPGSTLVFMRDENITATTVDCHKKYIILRGERISLNKATILLKKEVQGLVAKNGWQSPAEWLYEGKLLSNIRKEMEMAEY